VNFICDPGLVLYLPLHELDGSSFMSRDAYGHLCTATGAAWRPEGYLFDGSDDYIKHTAPNWRGGDSSGTILVWFKTSSATSQTFLSSADESFEVSYLHFGIRPDGLLQLIVRTAENDVVRGDTNLADGAWHLGVVVSSGTAWSLYTDNANEESLTVGAGSNNGNWFADVSARDNFTIGARERTSVDSYLTGSIRQVWVYNRVLTVQEIQHIYLATKWRYR